MVTFQPHLDVIFSRGSEHRPLMQAMKASSIIIVIMSGKAIALVFGLIDKWTWTTCAQLEAKQQNHGQGEVVVERKGERGEKKKKKTSREEDWRP